MNEIIKSNLILYRQLLKKAVYNKEIFRKLFVSNYNLQNKSKLYNFT